MPISDLIWSGTQSAQGCPLVLYKGSIYPLSPRNLPGIDGRHKLAVATPFCHLSTRRSEARRDSLTHSEAWPIQPGRRFNETVSKRAAAPARTDLDRVVVLPPLSRTKTVLQRVVESADAVGNTLSTRSPHFCGSCARIMCTLHKLTILF